MSDLGRNFSDFSGGQGDRASFKRIGQNLSYADKVGSERRLTDLIDSLKFSASTIDLHGAIATLKSAVNLAKTQADSNMLKEEPNFAKVTEVFRNGLSHLSEQQALDALFILRKGQSGAILAMTGQDYDAIKAKMNSLIEEDAFTLRQLSGLYFNYCCLRWPCDKLVKKINDLLEDNPTQITDALVTQAILGICIKGSQILPSEIRLIDTLCKSHDLYLEQMDYKRKSELFKNLARLELNINSTRSQLPPIFSILRKDLKDNIDKLGEDEVINVIHAYAYLPKQFTNDLIEEFRNMVEVTLDQNALNLKSYFLLRYIEAQPNLTK